MVHTALLQPHFPFSLPLPSFIALVGMPGSGKTALGRALAKRLERVFVDIDQRVEDRVGCSIPQFFELAGEARFREAEAAALEETLNSKEALVISTGGGCVLSETNRQRLREQAHVLYLEVSLEALLARLSKDKTRPLLQVADPGAKLEAMYAQRVPLYSATAHGVLNSTELSKGQALSQLEAVLYASLAQQKAERFL